jgi:hypothetical protein
MIRGKNRNKSKRDLLSVLLTDEPVQKQPVPKKSKISKAPVVSFLQSDSESSDSESESEIQNAPKRVKLEVKKVTEKERDTESESESDESEDEVEDVEMKSSSPVKLVDNQIEESEEDEGPVIIEFIDPMKAARDRHEKKKIAIKNSGPVQGKRTQVEMEAIRIIVKILY